MNPLLVPPLAPGRIPVTAEVRSISGRSARTMALRDTAPADPFGDPRKRFWVCPVVAVMVTVPPRDTAPEEVNQVGVIAKVIEEFWRLALGRLTILALGRVPEVMLEALVVSVVAEVAKATPLVFRTVRAADPGPAAVPSPVRAVI